MGRLQKLVLAALRSLETKEPVKTRRQVYFEIRAIVNEVLVLSPAWQVRKAEREARTVKFWERLLSDSSGGDPNSQDLLRLNAESKRYRPVPPERVPRGDAGDIAHIARTLAALERRGFVQREVRRTSTRGGRIKTMPIHRAAALTEAGRKAPI